MSAEYPLGSVFCISVLHPALLLCSSVLVSSRSRWKDGLQPPESDGTTEAPLQVHSNAVFVCISVGNGGHF